MTDRGKGFWKPWLGGLILVAMAAIPGSKLTLDWLGEELTPEPPPHLVEALPAGYDPFIPSPPYAGPHPSLVPFDAGAFQLPVQPGEVGPLDSFWPPDYPFACATEESDLGQPLVDNQQGAGTPVQGPDGQVLGYSKDCRLKTRVDYYYLPAGQDPAQDQLKPLPAGALPADMGYKDGKPLVLRIERGTLGRYIYGIAMLADPKAGLGDASRWNQRIIFNFKGGVGIGSYQGRLRLSDMTKHLLPQLLAGYAVLSSSGNITSTHYDLWRAARNAQLVKAQFVARYGQPRYTVGIGGSGGAVQQYVLSETAPGLLDALVPLYSFPDMVTQSIWALDCELLEYYFDQEAGPRWQRQEERTLVEGLAASSTKEQRYRRFENWSQWLQLKSSRMPPGATECAASWRGLGPMTNNPRYFHRARFFAPELAKAMHFSYWHDLAPIYGLDDQGYGYRTFDNLGVQYGLEALKEGKLSVPEFLHLNAHIGGWKPPAQQQPERYWVLSGDEDLTRLSLWSDQNMQKRPGGVLPLSFFQGPAPKTLEVARRNQGYPAAQAAAYHGGQVFLGRERLPTIDFRPYLDPSLNMHHSFASLSAKARMLRAQGSADNLVIWMADKPYEPIAKILALVDRWLTTGRKPAEAVDSCFKGDGEVIAQGPGVWDGPWDGKAEGACLQAFPAYSSPRNRAGSPLAGDIFRCARIPVDAALAQGLYAPVDMRPWRDWLKLVFKDGVCDYSQGDQARPSDEDMGLAP
ncbi:DUF6351 family protein [Gallaecimonas kandeliae]|uniref:DUF6351 family protein n=1 Tax=Gallaecimonas kandeliae TaxID=3029055 RepID=UPI002647542D|nr:DUF6351 family protein [Gallaecimonas kandeliae]WKE65501.1 DUF6351 family protein [Gallaecimonas kandeliae]